MDPIEQKVINAYMEAFGRRPMADGLNFYVSVLRQNPDFDIMGELQASPEYELQQAYRSAGLPPASATAAKIYASTPANRRQAALSSLIQGQGGSAPQTSVAPPPPPPPTATGGGVAQRGPSADYSPTYTYSGPAGTGSYVDSTGAPAPTGGITNTTVAGSFDRTTGRTNRPAAINTSNNTAAQQAGNTATQQVGNTPDYRQIVVQAYQDAFGRAPRDEALNAYAAGLESGYFTPQSLLEELQGSSEAQLRQRYRDAGFEVEPPLAVLDALNSGRFTVDEAMAASQQIANQFPFFLDRGADQGGFENYLNQMLLQGRPLGDIVSEISGSSENTTNQESLADFFGPGGVAANTDPDRLSIADMAYNLATQGRLDFPDYQVAGLTPDQLAAADEFREFRGTYKPFLEQGAESTMRGIGALGEALSGTRTLGSQIPGEIAPGQQALGAAAGDLQRFAGQGAEAADIASQRARASTAEAQRALQEASRFGQTAAEQGIAGLRGSTDMYSPDMIAPFMNDYENAAVQQALSDLARQGELRERDLEAQAVQAGAFGGSRQAVAEQELARNVMEQQGRTAAEMRNQGYESAAQRSQAAFEDAMRRRQQGAQLTGQLGQIGSGAAAGAAEAGGRLGLDAEQLAQTGGLSGAQMQMTGAEGAGNLGLQSANLGLSGIQAGLGAQQQAAGIGQGIAGLGLQSANMGGLAQQYQAQDLSTLMQMGQQQQAQQQTEFDAQRLNQYQNMMIPFQQLAFASDIMNSMPTGIVSTMSQPIQGPSMLSQIGGLALGIGGLMGGGI